MSGRSHKIGLRCGGTRPTTKGIGRGACQFTTKEIAL
jgi:hypothetical protein